MSVPQAMLARPVVAGAVAGWLAGDVEAGLRVGVLFELFALDVLPVGAVRYPDYGPATVAAVALAAGSPWQFALGVSAALGLVLAVLGGFSLSSWCGAPTPGPFSAHRPRWPRARAARSGGSSTARWLRDAVRGGAPHGARAGVRLASSASRVVARPLHRRWASRWSRWAAGCRR